MERAARAWQQEHCDDDNGEAQARLWSEPAVDALLSSLTHVRCDRPGCRRGACHLSVGDPTG